MKQSRDQEQPRSSTFSAEKPLQFHAAIQSRDETQAGGPTFPGERSPRPDIRWPSHKPDLSGQLNRSILKRHTSARWQRGTAKIYRKEMSLNKTPAIDSKECRSHNREGGDF